MLLCTYTPHYSVVSARSFIVAVLAVTCARGKASAAPALATGSALRVALRVALRGALRVALLGCIHSELLQVLRYTTAERRRRLQSFGTARAQHGTGKTNLRR